jgi:hypothetical protein
MNRVGWLLVVLIATAGAAQKQSLPLSLPLPPKPPAHPPADRRAPVPDLYVSAPREGPSPLPNFTVRDFRIDDTNHSLGYTPGSKFETSEDKRSIQTPGLSFRVPLQ